MPKEATNYLAVDPWAIVEKGFHRGRALVSESIFSLANEYMGVRGCFEEDYGGDTLAGSYFNGVFEEAEIRHPHVFKGMVTSGTFVVNSVDWLGMRLELDEEKLDLNESKFSRFTRRLDLKFGTLERRFVWQTRQGKELQLTFVRFVSMDHPHLGAQRVVMEPLNFSGSVKVRCATDFSQPHRTRGNRNYWRVLRKGREDGLHAILAETEHTRHRVFSCFRLASNRPLKTKVFRAGKSVGCDLALPVTQGEPTRLDRLTINMTDKRPRATPEQVWDRGVKLARRQAHLAFDPALARHARFWEEVWRDLDIRIEGDPETQQGIRFCIFQLHQTYHGVDPRLNIGAKGLTGEVYDGCAWWDTETYCLPFYLFNNPAAARNLLEFRYRTLPGAVRRAREMDCEGARYPMCTHDGREICGVWQHGDLEIHVPAAIAYGIRHYDQVCADKDFLYGKGIEMLLQISRFYASRGAWSPLTGEFGFWGVMGADEFHMMVHNNCYTNVMARMSFNDTLRVMREMLRSAPERLEAVLRKVKLRPDEPAAWKKMAARMRISQDPTTGIFEQHDGYFDLPHTDVGKIPPTEFPIYDHWAYDRIFRTDMTKQPDVLLLHFLLSHDYSAQIKKANFDYYEPRCSHESSLSPSVHAILASELGYHDKAQSYSLHAARLDLDDYNRNTAEGLHTTSMAGAWLNIVYGYGGMRSDTRCLSFAPTLPASWSSYCFRILHRGSLLQVDVARKTVIFSIVRGSPLTIDVFGKPVKVRRAGTTIPLPTSEKSRS